MTLFCIDASAWVKRHHREIGSDWVDQLWSAKVPFGCATIGLIEVMCTLARRHIANRVAPPLADPIMHAVNRDFEAFSKVPFDEAVLA